MIRVTEAELSASDIRGIKKRIRFLEGKLAENHWPKLVLRTCLTLLAVGIVFAITQSPLWALLLLVPASFWAAAPLDLISTQKMQRDWLAYEKSRLETPRKTEISVEGCEYTDFGEVEDEGVLYLFSDNLGNWLMLEGQNYYPTDTFPSTSFRLSYDSNGALLEISSDSPRLAPRCEHDPATKIERELYFGMIDHAVVKADNENDALAKLKLLAGENTK